MISGTRWLAKRALLLLGVFVAFAAQAEPARAERLSLDPFAVTGEQDTGYAMSPWRDVLGAASSGATTGLERLAEGDAETGPFSAYGDRISITPYFGGVFFSGDIGFTESAMLGMRFGYEVPGLAALFLDFGYTRNDVRIRNTGFSNRGADGNLLHYSFYIAFHNPELELEPLDLFFGLGLGAFHANHYKGTVRGLRTQLADALFFHGAFFVELDYVVSDSFRIGFALREHVPFYAIFQADGNDNIVETQYGNWQSDTSNDGRLKGHDQRSSLVTEFLITISLLF